MVAGSIPAQSNSFNNLQVHTRPVCNIKTERQKDVKSAENLVSRFADCVEANHTEKTNTMKIATNVSKPENPWILSNPKIGNAPIFNVQYVLKDTSQTAKNVVEETLPSNKQEEGNQTTVNPFSSKNLSNKGSHQHVLHTLHSIQNEDLTTPPTHVPLLENDNTVVVGCASQSCDLVISVWEFLM